MRISVYLFIFIITFLSGFAEAKKVHSVFFEGTDHELNVYRVFGKEQGKTILLIGGIQGDEPGGFLSADLYADMALAKGNLIVVPRANFYSIVLNRRQVNEDMNRKFADDNRLNYETKVVTILKGLIAESDCLLNLHDGSGFYSKTWKSPQRNPKKYGQSIIADCENYETRDKKKQIKLGDIGREIVKKINDNIEKKEHKFDFNNHDTSSSSSLHKVQRKSATYYALTKCGIPAFGVETSKSLPLELKIRHHVFAINAFMEKYEVIPELPFVNMEKPSLQYLVMSVNNSMPVVVNNGQTLSVKPSDNIKIMHIEANFERGLTADIVGVGSVHDGGKSLAINKPTRIIVKKDHYPCGDVYISLSGGVEKKQNDFGIIENKGGAFLMYKVKVNGVNRIIDNYGSVNIVNGDIFEIEDVITTTWDSSDIVVNFKGYVGNSSVNTGEDRGFKINTAKDLWPNYSLNKKGLKYQVVTNHKNAIIGKLFVVIESPAFAYIIVKNKDGNMQCFKNGDEMKLGYPQENKLQIDLVDIISNVGNYTGIEAVLQGTEGLKHGLNIGKPVDVINKDGKPSYNRIDISRYGKSIGSVSINYISEREMRRTGQDEQI